MSESQIRKGQIILHELVYLMRDKGQGEASNLRFQFRAFKLTACSPLHTAYCLPPSALYPVRART